jgi:UDP-N-acetylmuramoyl-L-alanyl-D-glutamate--2,6-diaminopimelate ligase
MTVRIEVIARALDDAGLLVERRGAFPETVTDITDDSRAVGNGAIFVAVHGTERDGHDYLASAASAGASVAIVQDASRTDLPALVVNDGRRAAAVAASAFFGWPAREMQLVGVTGTNGKTTTVNMLRHLLDDGNTAASIGTLGVLIGQSGEVLGGAAHDGSGLTTPGPVDLQRVLRALRDRGVRRVAMEVSSHSLEQQRVEGLKFAVAVFTNFTREHLDYHHTMDAYFRAKARLLDHLTPTATVVVNRDDAAWSALPADRSTIGFSERLASAPVHAEDVHFSGKGSDWTLVIGEERAPVRLPLIGDFNVINALGAAAAAHALSVPVPRIASRLDTVPQVPGRLEILRNHPTVLRDYSHKPYALERAIAAVRPFTPGRLIVLFGCGGDRDKGKRPEMGAIAERDADWVILTSDNPRREDPEAILDDIERGMSKTNHERIEDRRAAIARALDIAAPDDVVLLAGKGHETYQIRGTTKLPFDEREIVAELSEGERDVASSGGRG